MHTATNTHALARMMSDDYGAVILRLSNGDNDLVLFHPMLEVRY